jgi:hypothetical protein
MLGFLAAFLARRREMEYVLIPFSKSAPALAESAPVSVSSAPRSGRLVALLSLLALVLAAIACLKAFHAV